MRVFLLAVLLAATAGRARGQVARTVGRLQEVFAWKQVHFNINGVQVTEDRFGEDGLDNTRDRDRRQAGTGTGFVFDNSDGTEERNWDQRPGGGSSSTTTQGSNGFGSWSSTSTTTPNPNEDAGRFFIQYNNLPMGVERVGERLFVTLPRRRYGIPSTLNYLDLREDTNERSPGLRPYPDLRSSRALTSVYRTRADRCGRLWMVDTGLLEIPNNRQQVQQPAVVAYDLNTDRQILRHPLKSTDIISEVTPTGLASITIELVNDDCSDAYAYIPDLATYGLIVFSLRERDTWRLSHNYFHFTPTAGNLRIAGQRFQWNDGIFSITLTEPRQGSCRTAYFHAMVGTTEFSVSTCALRNRTAAQDSDFWTQFSVVGDRGANSHSTMHGYHTGSRVVFFADIARDALSCWHTASPLSSAAVGILAQDSTRLSYPSDLHVTEDEVWVMANSLPVWAYSRLDTSQYNFFIYKANVQDLIAGTVCSGRAGVGLTFRSGDGDGDNAGDAPSNTECETEQELPALQMCVALDEHHPRAPGGTIQCHVGTAAQTAPLVTRSAYNPPSIDCRSRKLKNRCGTKRELLPFCKCVRTPGGTNCTNQWHGSTAVVSDKRRVQQNQLCIDCSKKFYNRC